MSFPVLLVGTDETRSVGLRVKRPRYIYVYLYQHVGPDMQTTLSDLFLDSTPVSREIALETIRTVNVERPGGATLKGLSAVRISARSTFLQNQFGHWPTFSQNVGL
jgi:hypothetical protein